jgi:hypothetical protein
MKVFTIATVLFAGVVFQRVDYAAGKTVWDGVYSEPQAQRGKETYTRECLQCHGAGLEGTTGNGPGSAGGVSLSGAAFKRNWYSSSLNDLYDKISKTMPAQPPTRTGKMTQPEVLDLMSFILSYNGFPAGAELTYQPGLSVTDIVSKEGPEPPQTGETARAIGCLTAGDRPNLWLLSKSTAPIKSKSTGLSAGPELERASTTALGTNSLLLLNARPGTAAPAGSKVEVKGRYIRMDGEDRLSVLSFQMLSPTCS